MVSLAVQLADSVKKLCEFWNSVRDAPEDVRAISTELELLMSVLTEIAAGAQHVEPDVALIAVLKHCTLKVKTLGRWFARLMPTLFRLALGAQMDGLQSGFEE